MSGCRAGGALQNGLSEWVFDLLCMVSLCEVGETVPTIEKITREILEQVLELAERYSLPGEGGDGMVRK